MKKNYAFVLVALVLLGVMSPAFAQNSITVQKITGVRGIAFRTYCSFATLFGANSDRCFVRNQNGAGNTASVGAVGMGNNSDTSGSSSASSGNQGAQTASIGGFAV